MLSKFKKLRNKPFCEKKFVCTKSTDKDFIIYERVELEKMTIKTLRALAKQRKINLQKKRKNDVMVEKNGDLFVNPILALHAASFLSVKLYYEILDFYLYAKYSKMEEIYNSKIESLEQQLVVAELGLKFNKVLLWSNFNASFAFYYFVIDNVVKCGAVGLKDQENSDNLDSRLASHRSTFARFKLINVIKFKDSNTVTLFESWIKQVLAKYSIETI